MTVIRNSYSVHGAPYLPWSTFFRKITQSETFVVLDNVLMTNGRSYLNRCKVDNGREFYLTIPIARPSGSATLRKEVFITGDATWRRKHKGTLKHIYGHSTSWNSIIEPVLQLLDSESNNLFELNISLITKILTLTGSLTKVVRASGLPVSCGNPTTRLVEIGQHLNKNTYISGVGALDYMEAHKFDVAGIKRIIVAPTKSRCQGQEDSNWNDRGLTCIDELSVFGANTTWNR